MGDSSLSLPVLQSSVHYRFSITAFCLLLVLDLKMVDILKIRKKKKTIVVLQSDILNGKLDLKELENSDKNSKYTNKEEKKEAHEDV